MNRGSKHDAWIEATNRKEADRLRDELASVIMRNGRLAAEVADRWARKHGYYFQERKAADAEMRRKYPPRLYPQLYAKARKVKAGRKVEA